MIILTLTSLRRKVRVDTLLCYVSMGNLWISHTTDTIQVIHENVKHNFKISQKSCFPKSLAASVLFAAAAPPSTDIDVIRHALIMFIIDALLRLTIDTHVNARVADGTRERIHSCFFAGKILTAGIIAPVRMRAADTDLSLAAKLFTIIETVLHTAF